MHCLVIDSAHTADVFLGFPLQFWEAAIYFAYSYPERDGLVIFII